MRHYTTLADSRYLPQSLAMYESLRRHSSEEFKLWFLAMDRDEDLLNALNLPGLYPCSIMIMELMMPDLGVIKKSRTWQEYCWTVASVFTHRVIFENPDIENITYLDADIFFFSDPTVIFDEIGNRSIGIIPHRLIPSKKHLERNGRFNVSWVTFRDTVEGKECLSTWAHQCKEWCFYRNEGPGKFGDQGYLDAWPEKYGEACRIIENIGAGVAPWNLANYQLYFDRDGFIHVKGPDPKPHGISKRIVFYHAHEFLEREDGSIRLTNYELRNEDREYIYKPYIEAYKAAKERIASVHLQAR
jgi:hypothetical protein